MHYSHLIKIPNIMPASNNIVDVMRNNVPTPAPDGYEDTVLNDEEISEVMATLVSFHNKYFPDIPMAEELDPRFIWNLPIEIYKAHIHVKEYELDDMLDPLILFYLFTTPCPEEAYGHFLLTIHNYITSCDTYEDLKNISAEYVAFIQDDEKEDVDE